MTACIAASMTACIAASMTACIAASMTACLGQLEAAARVSILQPAGQPGQMPLL